MFLGESLISWKRKKQQVMARSSVELEYRIVATVTSEIVWLVALLKNFGFVDKQPASLYSDNKTCTALFIATNPIFHEKTKYIDIDCRLIREKIQDGVIKTFHVPTRHLLGRPQFGSL